MPQIQALNDVGILGLAERVAVFTQMSARGPRIIAVPDKVIDVLLHKNGHVAPAVNGLVSHPLVLPGGKIVAEDGLHEKTGLFFVGAQLPDIHAHSQTEAGEALERLRSSYLEGFEFESELDGDAALAGLITGVQRKVMDVAPGHAILAAAQSSGKTSLAKRCHIVLTGRDMPVTTFPEADEAEVQKRVLSLLLRSPAMVCFDNIPDGFTFHSASLASAMTGPLYEQRLLGLNKEALVPTNVLFVITGNNLNLGPDEVTRWLPSRLAPLSATPHERRFKHPDLLLHGLSIREQTLRDVVGIVAGYLESGASIPARSRFPKWDRFVRQPLMWAGARDVAEIFATNAQQAEHVLSLEALQTALRERFGTTEFTAAAVAKEAALWAGGRLTSDDPDSLASRLAAALEGLRCRSTSNSRSVGRCLNAVVNRSCLIGPTSARVTARLLSRPKNGALAYRLRVEEQSGESGVSNPRSPPPLDKETQIRIQVFPRGANRTGVLKPRIVGSISRDDEPAGNGSFVSGNEATDADRDPLAGSLVASGHCRAGAEIPDC